MVSANDIYRDTSFMGGLLDFEFSETYLGLTGALNTTNPITDTASDTSLISDLATIEADHANGLATYHAATTENILTGGDEAYDGSYWQARNPQNILARVVANHIPAYLVGGEFDIFQNGEPLNYAELQNAWDGRSVTAPMQPGQRTTGRYQLIVGPWEHLNGSSVDVDPLELEWFDTWLKHEQTGMPGTPTPLHYYDLGSGQFDETSTYPFTGATPTRLYFGPSGTLTSTAPPANASGTSPTLPVSTPTPVSGVLGTILGSAPIGTLTRSDSVASSALPTGDTLVWSPAGAACGRSIDQWSMGGISVPAGEAGLLAPCADNDQLTQMGPWAITYTTAPLSHTETVAGPIDATVYASATTAQTELVAELEDVTPDGSSYPVTEGALLGSLRTVNKSRSWTAAGVTILPYHPYTESSAQPVTPGAVTEYQIQLFPTLATIAAGNSLRLTLSTTDTPHLTPLPGDLPKLAGGVYTISRTASAPSSLNVELLK
jgi:predicted acyl esterase